MSSPAHTVDVLVICETGPAGDAMLRSVEAVLGADAQCHPIWSHEEYQRALPNLSMYSCVLLGNVLGWTVGLSVVEDIATRSPAAPIIMITDSYGADLVAAGFRHGVRDFLRSTQFDRLPGIIAGALNQDVQSAGGRMAGEQEREYRDQYQATSSVLSDYVFSYYINPNGHLDNEWRSDGLRKISGYTHQEFEELAWERVVHPDDHEVVWRRRRHVLKGESPVSEYRITTRDGDLRWVREYARPIWDPAETRYSRFIGSVQDITEERRAEDARTSQMHVLELIATGSAFEVILDSVIALIENDGHKIHCAIHRLDEQSDQLRLLRASNLTASFQGQIEALDVSGEASCQASALANNQMVVISDLDDEDRWSDHAEFARDAGYQSLAVMPIAGCRRNGLGTLTVYRMRPGEPSTTSVERIIGAAWLLGVAAEKAEAEGALQRAELRYRQLAEEIPAITFIASATDNLQVEYLSPQADAMLGGAYTAKLRSGSLLDLVHADDRRAVAAALQCLAEDHSSALIEFRVNAPGVDVEWLQCSAVLIEGSFYQDSCWNGVLSDVTVRRRAEKALRESQLQYRALFDNNPHLVFSLDTHGRFQRINPATGRVTGYREEDLLGRPFTSVLVAGELEQVWRHFRCALQGEPQQFDTEIFTRHGDRLHLSVTTVPVFIDGEIRGVSGIAQDITEQVSLQGQLAHQAYHDSLTGLPNRVMFSERLSQTLSMIERTHESLAVLFVDLDDFKMVNDSIGHESGDEYLKITSRRLQLCIDEPDIVARFGGDEFVVLLTYSREAIDHPVQVAEEIGAKLRQPVLMSGHEITTGVSIGISIHSGPGGKCRDLLRHADIALFQAKRGGASTLYRVFEDAMHQKLVERLEIERGLRRALRRDEFVVHYQPIIDLHTGRIGRVEALVRWQHPERGLLSPAVFLPVAEETGQVTGIDVWVLREACRRIAMWNQEHLDAIPLVLGVNLSARDFRQPDLSERIRQTLREAGCDPSWVKLEITESMMMQDVTVALETLERLRDIGIGFSIDDFGTGYSSLAYLQRLPLDTLKIDRSFIDGLGGEESDELMVRTIISLASALSLEVIAEGIETTLQLNRARELGCNFAQGYLIARPMPFDDLAPLLGAQEANGLQRHFG